MDVVPVFAGAAEMALPVSRRTHCWNASDPVRTLGNTPSPPLLAGRRNVVMRELAHADRIPAASLRVGDRATSRRVQNARVADPWRVPMCPAASSREQTCELWKIFTV